MISAPQFAYRRYGYRQRPKQARPDPFLRAALGEPGTTAVATNDPSIGGVIFSWPSARAPGQLPSQQSPPAGERYAQNRSSNPRRVDACSVRCPQRSTFRCAKKNPEGQHRRGWCIAAPGRPQCRVGEYASRSFPCCVGRPAPPRSSASLSPGPSPCCTRSLMPASSIHHCLAPIMPPSISVPAGSPQPGHRHHDQVPLFPRTRGFPCFRRRAAAPSFPDQSSTC